MSATVYSELKTPGDWLKYELDPESRYCREEVTLLSSGTEYTIQSGTVLGKVTATGKYRAQQPDNPAAEGTNVSRGILLYTAVVPAAGDYVATAIVRGPAVVSNDGLFWSADTDLNQAAAIVELEALNIQVREGV